MVLVLVLGERGAAWMADGGGAQRGMGWAVV